MTPLDKLIRYFEQFPGIGSRQAKRFAFHVLTMRSEDTTELGNLIANLKTNVVQCQSCQRFFSTQRSGVYTCSICGDENRDRQKLMVVAQDSDIPAVEKSNVYDGLYFVLGGTVPLLHSDDIKQLRGGALKVIVEDRLQTGLSEIILAFAVNPDGENTARYVESLLRPLFTKIDTPTPNISQLGRGLSTGSELEYADPETIKNALRNRG